LRERKPTINELNKPASATDALTSRALSISNNISKPAPKITGMANKKENLADSLALRPRRRAQLIVMPLLEIPGIIANAWARPIIKEIL
tara:strand:- start:55 stop:321 length:267 start_codon:yes stop_codon:yes gene_type:complete